MRSPSFTGRPLATRRIIGCYAGLAALAALLGSVETAQAGIVTRNLGVTLVAANVESFDLDVDLDGTIDFTFTAAFVADPIVSAGFDVVDFPFASANGVVIDAVSGDGFPAASRLAVGDTISETSLFSFAAFDQGNLFFFTSFDPPSGNFGGAQGVIGLRFESAGGTRFGFAEVAVNALDAAVDPLNLTILRVGYEDAPGAAISIADVPTPSSLALFAVGAIALGAGLRRQSH